MKRILLVFVIFFTAGIALFAQQRAPSKQEMQDYLNQVKTKTSEFDSILEDIKNLNDDTGLARQFIQLKNDISRLDERIQKEADNITAVHDRGNRISPQRILDLERMMNQRKNKQRELEFLLSS